MTNQEIKEILDQQVKLLAEASEKASANELRALSEMILAYVSSGVLESIS